MTYTAPVRDMSDVLYGVCDIASVAPEVEADLIAAILEEAGKFAAGVFAPLNRVGDQTHPVLENGVVRTPPGFRQAYAQFVEAGWNCLSGPEEFGGQGLPYVLQIAVQEMMTSANMAFSLCPLLSQGAIEALSAHGAPAQKATFLPKLVSGEWTGTMNLTEPQAGSDVGALKTRAEPVGDGAYRIAGQKIFITWGEHDCADNIAHLVLARLPDAPPGTRGISLFLVPKFHVNDDGSLGPRNDLRCVSLEHKLGIHASPTCVMSFGDNGDCIGTLIGEENRGMSAMFTMMNNARVGVGLQGVAIAERAYQAAAAYAMERVQSAKFGGKGHESVRIIEHADVRRMLMTMKANIAAARAIVYLTAASIDRGHRGDDAGRGLADLLTPVAKGHATDLGVEMTSLALQVFGGMGFIEETGVAQHYRDARIAPIYEGTNGIQAIDLVGRKLRMDGGAHWRALFADLKALQGDVAAAPALAAIAPYLEDGVDALESATVWLAGNAGDDLIDTAAGATPYLRMFGIVLGGALLARQALHTAAAQSPDAPTRATLAQFYAEQILPTGTALLGPVTRGAELLYALDEGHFAA